MKCSKCGRALREFTAVVQTPDGEIGWGPVCARKVFRQAKRTARSRPKRVVVEERHLALELA